MFIHLSNLALTLSVLKRNRNRYTLGKLTPMMVKEHEINFRIGKGTESLISSEKAIKFYFPFLQILKILFLLLKNFVPLAKISVNVP